MFRVWGKIMKDNRLVKDTVVEIANNDMSRTKKTYEALDEMCRTFDLARPIWLETNKKEFIRLAKTRFTQDSFIETIEFDYLEFHVIEEDYG